MSLRQSDGVSGDFHLRILEGEGLVGLRPGRAVVRGEAFEGGWFSLPGPVDSPRLGHSTLMTFPAR